MTEYRALLTDREREVLSGEANVSNNYVYQIRSRVRRKLGRLEGDIEVLSAHHPDLFAEFLDVVDANSPTESLDAKRED